ncbi:MAG: hypothetical protein VX498_03215 [Myxococcota bacterium]|nr:hypothetical protein [Myxococcota bacterium]
MDHKLLFDEFAASMVRERSLNTSERLSDWSAAVKSRFVRLGRRRGYMPFATDDRRKSAAYLWDVAWTVEDKLKRGQAPSGAGIEGLKFPRAAYRRLILTAEVEWGRQGQRPHTQVFRQNLEEVFRDFYKLMDARSPNKVMVYTSWLYPDQAGIDGLFLRGFRQILLDYESHQPGDTYLFVEFDDRQRKLSGYQTSVPKRGPRSFRLRPLGSVSYPRRWDPAHI